MGSRVSVGQHQGDVERLLADLIRGGRSGGAAGGRGVGAMPGAGVPDPGASDVGVPDAEAPDVGKPDAEVLGVGEALGRVLATDVVAPEPLPRFRNSQMDGFAVRATDVAGASADTPVVLPVAGEIAARPGRPDPLAPGSAVRIMTGAPVPDGADAVVPVEDTDVGTFNRGVPGPPSSDTVRVCVPRAAGDFVREAGSDVRAGDLVLPAGTVLGPHHLAAAAACGIGRLPLRRRIRVAIVSTGSELVAPGEPAGPGQIWDANAVALAAAVRAAGAEVARADRVGDDEDAARGTLRRAASAADVVITSGGVSQGAHEVVKDVLADVVFRPVAMQPGGPQGFGRLDGTPVLTFPGNPVSAQVSFVVFLRDLLRRAGGLPPVGVGRAVLGPEGMPDGGLVSPGGKRQFLRGRFRDGGAAAGPRTVATGIVADAVRRAAGGETAGHGGGDVASRTTGTLVVDVVGGPGSHLVASMAVADVLIDVPADVTELRAGDEVTILPL